MKKMTRKLRERRKWKFGKLRLGRLRELHWECRCRRCRRCRRRRRRRRRKVNRRSFYPLINRRRIIFWCITLRFDGCRDVDIHIELRLQYRDPSNSRLLINQ